VNCDLKRGASVCNTACNTYMFKGEMLALSKGRLKKDFVTVCAAVCCSVLQCVAVCCSVLQCVAVCYRELQLSQGLLQKDFGAVCCIVLQCTAVCCSVLVLQLTKGLLTKDFFSAQITHYVVPTS